MTTRLLRLKLIICVCVLLRKQSHLRLGCPGADGKCAKNFYYDGLLEDCRHCSIRCNSPPTVCSTYCRGNLESNDGARNNHNVRVILIVLFVFLGAGTTLTVILQVIRRKACKHAPITKAGEQDSSESERVSDTTEQSEDTDGAANGAIDLEKRLSSTHCNSSLPLPSTEEGTTMLVTAKTVQTYDYSLLHTQGGMQAPGESAHYKK